MHETLKKISEELSMLSKAIDVSITSEDSFNIAHGNWSFPGISKVDLTQYINVLNNKIIDSAPDSIDENEEELSDYIRRLTFLRQNLPQNIWSNPPVAVQALYFTLHFLWLLLEPNLRSDLAAASRAASRAVTRIRALEARLADIEPRSAGVSDMVGRIEAASEAADQLPADLLSLAEAQKKLKEILKATDEDRIEISVTKRHIDELEISINESQEEAKAITERLDSAYSAATSQGLAAAFSERSKALDKSMWIWVIGLMVALTAGAVFGSRQLHNIVELMATPSGNQNVIVLNMILAVLSVSAPVWFGWLATKQVGQRFRLSEDYAFKASVSRAYEGYRREAARVDGDLEAKLLASALERLDEQPLRLVESASYGSPWHEVASSGAVRDALKSIPGFSGEVMKLAGKALSAAGLRKAGANNPGVSKLDVATE